MKQFLRILFGRPSPSEPDGDNPVGWLSLDYVHDRALNKLEAQSATWDAVDARLRLILGVIGIVFAAALGLQRGATAIPGVAGLLAMLAVALYLIAGVGVAIAYWPTDFDRPPKLSFLRQEFLTVDPRETKLAVIDTIIEAYNKNALVIGRKTLIFKVAFVLTGIATGLLGAAVIAQTACQTSGSWPWRNLGC